MRWKEIVHSSLMKHIPYHVVFKMQVAVSMVEGLVVDASNGKGLGRLRCTNLTSIVPVLLLLRSYA